MTDFKNIDQYSKCGFTYTKIEVSDRYMLWRLSRDNQFFGYELWEIPPNGVWTSPCEEKSDTKGWYVFQKFDESACWKQIAELKQKNQTREV